MCYFRIKLFGFCVFLKLYFSLIIIVVWTRANSRNCGPRLDLERAHMNVSKKGLGPNQAIQRRYKFEVWAEEKGKLDSLGRRLKIIKPCLGYCLIEGIVICPNESWRKSPDEAIVSFALNPLHQPAMLHLWLNDYSEQCPNCLENTWKYSFVFHTKTFSRI